MKLKRLLFIFSILCLTFVVAAFTILPSIHLQGPQAETFDISYTKAEVRGNTLVLHVDYESYGTSFEIGKDIAVATDRKFSQPLHLISCVPKDSQYVYTFEYDDGMDSRAETLYIEPPVLYAPTEIEAISMPFAEDAALRTADGDSWFSITSIAIDSLADGMYAVSVGITPHASDLPRLPELVVGEHTFVGSTLHNFNSAGMFDYGVFAFVLPADDADEVSTILKNASIRIDQALYRVSARDTIFSSNVKSISIVSN